MTPITTPVDAESALDQLAGLMNKLSALLRQETDLVHAGKIRGAAAMTAAKQEVAGQLLAAGERIKANAKYLRQVAPARCAALQQMQNAFAAIAQKNMIVLTTAHAVSEGIVRRLSSDMTRKASPQVYGASGRALTPDPRRSRPLALSKML